MSFFRWLGNLFRRKPRGPYPYEVAQPKNPLPLDPNAPWNT